MKAIPLALVIGYFLTIPGLQTQHPVTPCPEEDPSACEEPAGEPEE